MTENHGLNALCFGFYLPDFMQLETQPPLSWRNVEIILNHRTQEGDRRALVTHLYLSSGPQALGGEGPSLPVSLCSEDLAQFPDPPA